MGLDLPQTPFPSSRRVAVNNARLQGGKGAQLREKDCQEFLVLGIWVRVQLFFTSIMDLSKPLAFPPSGAELPCQEGFSQSPWSWPGLSCSSCSRGRAAHAASALPLAPSVRARHGHGESSRREKRPGPCVHTLSALAFSL